MSKSVSGLEIGPSSAVSARISKILKNAKSKKWSGFTLVELVVVITVLAILATIGFLALSGYSQDAKDVSVKANVRSVQTAISSESAISNNSPRYYVVHDSGAALSGAFVYLDGSSAALTGWAWNEQGTNYSAGNPDYAKLKLNPEKFKVALSGTDSLFSAALDRIAAVSAAYDAKYLTVGAFDASVSSGTKKRSVSYFQVAGISPATGATAVSGNYPTNLSWSVAGLVKDAKSSSSTWALVDGANSTLPPSPVPGSCGTASKAYPATSVSFGSDALCVSGTATPASPAFPAIGGSVSWTCPWQNNGAVANCSASKAYYASCNELKTAGNNADGVYAIDPDSTGPGASVQAYCDMTNDGGGWTMVAKSVYKPGLTASGWDLFVNNANGAKGDASVFASTDTVKMTTANINALVFGGEKKLRYNRYDLSKRWIIEYSAGQTLDFTTFKSYNISLTLPTQEWEHVSPFYGSHPHFMLFAGITDNGICTPATGNSRYVYGVWNTTLGTWGSNCNGTAEVWTPYPIWSGCTGANAAVCVNNGLDFTLFAK